MRRLVLLAPILALSCASGDDGDGEVTMRTPATPVVVADAGVAATVPAPRPPSPPPLGNDGWLDPPPTNTRWGGARAPKRTRESRPLAIQLRSTPPGATVMVDGLRVGATPTYWEGLSDGKAHDFVFILPEHAVAHYRFVPVQDGHLHPRLDKLLEPEPRDAGPLPGLPPPR